MKQIVFLFYHLTVEKVLFKEFFVIWNPGIGKQPIPGLAKTAAWITGLQSTLQNWTHSKWLNV